MIEYCDVNGRQILPRVRRSSMPFPCYATRIVQDFRRRACSSRVSSWSSDRHPCCRSRSLTIVTRASADLVPGHTGEKIQRVNVTAIATGRFECFSTGHNHRGGFLLAPIAQFPRSTQTISTTIRWRLKWKLREGTEPSNGRPAPGGFRYHETLESKSSVTQLIAANRTQEVDLSERGPIDI